MTRRRRFVIAVPLLLLTGTVAALLLVPRKSPLERAFDRVELQMSADEVSAIVGCKAQVVVPWLEHPLQQRFVERGVVATAGADLP